MSVSSQASLRGCNFVVTEKLDLTTNINNNWDEFHVEKETEERYF